MFTKPKIRNKFSISDLTTVIYSKTSWDIIFSFPLHFDFHVKTEVKDTILQYIFQAKTFLEKDHANIQFYFLDVDDLHFYCNHRNKPNLKSPPKEDAMELTEVEFKIHFLGIEEQIAVNENIAIPDKPGHVSVGLKNFTFLKMLGIGGFSKVYLVKKTDSNELYALKSVRLPDKRQKKDKKKYKDQIKNERDILVKIKHPFIVKLKYAFQVKRRFFFAMPFIQ